MTDKWSYSTPYGRWTAQRQPSGVWAAAYRAGPAGLPGGEFEAAVRRWRGLDDSGLPRLHSVAADDRQVKWVLPPHANWTPLAAAGPVAVDDARWVVREVGGLLGAMHHGRAAALDLAPHVVLVDRADRRVTVLPTLGLDRQAAAVPDGVARMPFVAPEVGGASPVDPARADVYGLGALAWQLLTGRERKATPGRLPSELDPSLVGWDAFVDGCCRSVPARRFASVDAALTALAVGPPAPQVAPTPTALPTRAPSSLNLPATRSPRPLVTRRRLLTVGSVGVAAVAAVAIVRPDWLAGLVPGAGRTLLGYERGFADTILAYKDRSYAGAAWAKLREADSLSEVARVGESGSAAQLHRVVGWDDDNYWVVRENGRVFQYRAGHWAHVGRPEHARDPSVRALDPDTLLAAGGYWDSGRNVYRVSARGITDLGDLKFSNRSAGTEVCPVAPDLFFCFSREWPHLNEYGVVRVADGVHTPMPERLYKESLVHREDNTPLKEFPVRWVVHTQSPTAGRALGVAVDGDRSYDGRKHKVVVFRDGLWYAVADLPEKRVNHAWFGAAGGDLRFAATVGDDGHVHLLTLGSPGLTQPVPGGTDPTPLALMRVWGVGPEKYWVMNRTGCVWERAGDRWRVVVRGLDRDEVEFVDAWVSPTGAVVAATEKCVYRLG